MDKEQFKFGSDRCLSVWIIHGGALSMILIVGLSLLVESGLPDFKSFIFSIGFFSLIFAPHTFLFLNHLKYERDTVVLLDNNQISILKHDVKKNFKLDDIIRVEEHEATRTPWMIIVKWKLISADDEVTLSSITFPRTKAWRLFGNKIDRRVTFFPTFP